MLVDVRGDDQIRDHGSIPGAIRIPRNVLEWRADPACVACDPRIADRGLLLVIVCQQGYQSSLAAANLHEMGFTRATDLAGGFEAWAAAGLPIAAAAAGGGCEADQVVEEDGHDLALLAHRRHLPRGDQRRRTEWAERELAGLRPAPGAWYLI